MAGGRWARQSYYEAIYAVANDILEDAECYMALKNHLQRVRVGKESDPIPQPKAEPEDEKDIDTDQSKTLREAVKFAKARIEEADIKANDILGRLMRDEKRVKMSTEYSDAIFAYKEAFSACSRVLSLDKLSFHSPWFREFYRRNYDALMIKSLFDNVIDDVDNVRHW